MFEKETGIKYEVFSIKHKVDFTNF